MWNLNKNIFLLNNKCYNNYNIDLYIYYNEHFTYIIEVLISGFD